MLNKVMAYNALLLSFSRFTESLLAVLSAWIYSNLLTTSTITHNFPPHYPNHHSPSTLPQPSLTILPPHYLNHHSQPSPHYLNLHTTSTIASHHFTLPPPFTHMLSSTLPQPSLTCFPPHHLNHHSRQPLQTTSTITHSSHCTLPQPSLIVQR